MQVYWHPSRAVEDDWNRGTVVCISIIHLYAMQSIITQPLAPPGVFSRAVYIRKTKALVAETTKALYSTGIYTVSTTVELAC